MSNNLQLAVWMNLFGALFPTLILSRLFLLLLWQWKKGVWRIAVANSVSFILYAALVPKVFFHEWPSLDTILQSWIYLPAQLLWFGIDFVWLRYRARKRTVE